MLPSEPTDSDFLRGATLLLGEAAGTGNVLFFVGVFVFVAAVTKIDLIGLSPVLVPAPQSGVHSNGGARQGELPRFCFIFLFCRVFLCQIYCLLVDFGWILRGVSPPLPDHLLRSKGTGGHPRRLTDYF